MRSQLFDHVSAPAGTGNSAVVRLSPSSAKIPAATACSLIPTQVIRGDSMFDGAASECISTTRLFSVATSNACSLASASTTSARCSR